MRPHAVTFYTAGEWIKEVKERCTLHSVIPSLVNSYIILVPLYSNIIITCFAKRSPSPQERFTIGNRFFLALRKTQVRNQMILTSLSSILIKKINISKWNCILLHERKELNISTCAVGFCLDFKANPS